jgi:hypothetical protein
MMASIAEYLSSLLGDQSVQVPQVPVTGIAMGGKGMSRNRRGFRSVPRQAPENYVARTYNALSEFPQNMHKSAENFALPIMAAQQNLSSSFFERSPPLDPATDDVARDWGPTGELRDMVLPAGYAKHPIKGTIHAVHEGGEGGEFDVGLTTESDRIGNADALAQLLSSSILDPLGGGATALRAGKALAAGDKFNPNVLGANVPPPIHDVPTSKVKAPYTMDEMASGRQVTPISGGANDPGVNLQDLQGGTIIPLSGDRTDVGTLTHVMGEALETPVNLQGGVDYMRHNQGWANDLGAARTIQNKVDDAPTDDVFGVFNQMGPDGSDYSVMTSVTATELLKGASITKKAKKTFNRQVQEYLNAPKKTGGEKPKNPPKFAGVDSPDLSTQLVDSGPVRIAFIKTMAKKEHGQAGFPHLGVIRHAVQRPDMVGLPRGAYTPDIGLGVMKMEKGAELIPTKDLKIPHETYNTHIPGRYMGSLKKLIPRDVMLSDFTKNRRNLGLPAGSDRRSIEISTPTQQATQQWLDAAEAAEPGQFGLARKWPVLGLK